jgi:hypothetical protein
MAPSARRNVAADVRQFLEKRLPCSFCDACLAFEFQTSLEEARTVALALAGASGYRREQSKCDGCGRQTEVTSVGGNRHRRK